MKTRFANPIPVAIAGVTTLIAASLFLHTASRRHHAAEERRLAAANHLHPDSAQHAGSDQVPKRLLPTGETRDTTIEKRLRSALSLPNSMDRTRALLALMKEFTSNDFYIALSSFPRTLADKRSSDFTMMFEEWLARDPAAATKFAANDGHMDDEAASILVKSDVNAALEWANADPLGKRLNLVIAQIATQDPDLALKVMSDLPVSDWRIPLAEIMQHGGRGQVLKWVDSLEDPAVQRTAASIAFKYWGGYQDMEERFSLLKKYPDALGNEDLGTIFAHWNEQDPTAARAALADLPAGTSRQNAFVTLFEEAILSADDANEMLRNYPDDMNDTVIAATISDNLAYRDGALAMERLELIEDPEIREKTTSKALSVWMHLKPDEAMKWLDEHPISPTVRQKLEQDGEEARKSDQEQLYDPKQKDAISR